MNPYPVTKGKRRQMRGASFLVLVFVVHIALVMYPVDDLILGIFFSFFFKRKLGAYTAK